MKKIIKLTETDLTRIVERVVNETKINVIKKSELDDTGTWSAEILTNKKKGLFLYIMKDGEYVKINKIEKKPLTGKDKRNKEGYVEFMKPEHARKINSLLRKVKELKAEADRLNFEAGELGWMVNNI